MTDAGMKAIEDSLRGLNTGFGEKNLVPFIRAFPSGEKRLQLISRTPMIYMAACKFIAHGGRYLVFINDRAEVELIAAMMRNPGADPMGVLDPVIRVAAETVPNGPELLPAVDRLISTSVERLDELQ